jgi:hypothetical protein
MQNPEGINKTSKQQLFWSQQSLSKWIMFETTMADTQ